MATDDLYRQILYEQRGNTMRDQMLTGLKHSILREIGYNRYMRVMRDPSQELTEITSEYREWRAIVTDSLAAYDLALVAEDIDTLVDHNGTVHDLLDYIQRKLDEKEHTA